MTGQRIKITDSLLVAYLEHRAAVVSLSVTMHDRSALAAFYRWLEMQHLTLHNVDRSLVSKFIGAKKWSLLSQKHHRCALKCYFRWLNKAGHITQDADDLVKPVALRDRDLCPTALEYQNLMRGKWRCQMSFSRSRFVLYHFHRWIDHHHIALVRVKKSDVKKFFEKLERKDHKQSYLKGLRMQLSLYFDWLADKGLLKCDFSGVLPIPRGTRAKNLTPVACAYLTELAAVRSPKTISSYKSTIAVFHTFLISRGVTIQNVMRADMLIWLQGLYARGLKPTSRQHFIIDVRLYLCWLHQNGHIDQDPHSLIQMKDLPKRPKLLPRPFPPEIDAEIMRRLETAHDIYARGLLLMRLTGIRVGELHALPFDCTLRDFNGKVSLKVPLGKLNSERLVPIDQRVVDIINIIQGLSQDYSIRAGKGWKCKYLITDPTGKPPYYSRFGSTLKSIARGLETAEPIVTHRLRHTYATSLLNAGMSIFAVMRLLGHTNITTTLIYAAVTMDLVQREYSTAQARLSNHYELKPLESAPAADLSPAAALEFALKILRKSAVFSAGGGDARKLILIEKRLARIRSELTQIIGRSPPTEGILK